MKPKKTSIFIVMKSRLNRNLILKVISALKRPKAQILNDKKDWYDRNSGKWTFFSTLITLGALAVSIIVMIDSKSVSNQNLDLYRAETQLQKEQIDQAQKDRDEDRILIQKRDSLDSLEFIQRNAINNLTLMALNDQAFTAKSALDEQKFNYKLQKELESPTLSVDSIAVSNDTVGYMFGGIVANIGKRPCLIEKAKTYIINPNKDYLNEMEYSTGHRLNSYQKFVVMNKLQVPFEIVTDENTSFFIYIRYNDFILNERKKFFTNLTFETRFFVINYAPTLKMPFYYSDSKEQIDSKKKFIKRKFRNNKIFN